MALGIAIVFIMLLPGAALSAPPGTPFWEWMAGGPVNGPPPDQPRSPQEISLPEGNEPRVTGGEKKGSRGEVVQSPERPVEFTVVEPNVIMEGTYIGRPPDLDAGSVLAQSDPGFDVNALTAGGFVPNIKVDAVTTAEANPDLDITSTGTIWVVYDTACCATTSTVKAASSTDKGKTWTVVTLLSGGYFRPAISIDSGNNIFVSATRYDGVDTKMAMICSTNAGSTWPVSGFFNVWNTGDYDFTTIATLGANFRAYIAGSNVTSASYKDNITRVANTAGCTTSGWSTLELGNAGLYDWGIPRIALTTNYETIFHEERFSGTDYDLYIKRRLFGGSYATVWTLGTGAMERRPALSQGSKAAGTGYLYGVWQDHSVGAGDIRMVYSTDEGATWTLATTYPATGANVQAFPDVYATTTGLAVAYADTTAPTHIKVSTYTTASGVPSASPSTALIATDTATTIVGQYRTVGALYDGGYARAAWIDNRNSGTEGNNIYYSSIGATWTVFVSPNGQSLQVIVDGTTYSPPSGGTAFDFIGGSSHTVNLVTPQGMCTWLSWSDAGAQSHTISPTTGAVSLTANFQCNLPPPTLSPLDSWLRTDTSIGVTDPAGCSNAGGGGNGGRYTIDDLGRAGVEVNAAGRLCNAAFTVTVGSASVCQTQTANQCHVEAWAYDSGGVAGQKAIIDYDIDYTIPTITINSPAAATWRNANFVFDVTNADTGGSGLLTCRYRVLSSAVETRAWTAYTCATDPTITVGAGQDCRNEGSNMCEVFVDASDTATNSFSTSRMYHVDFTAPTVGGMPADGWQYFDFDVTPTGSDTGGSGVQTCQYQIDDIGRGGVEVPWANIACSGTFTVSVGAAAPHCQTRGTDQCLVSIRSLDNAGNTATPQSNGFDIDYTGPTSAITSPADGWKGVDFSVTVDDVDAHSGVDPALCRYDVDDIGRVGLEISDAARTCDSTFTVTVGPAATCRTQGDNQCLVTVRAQDVAGNPGTDGSINYGIDYSLPSSTLSPGDSWRNADFLTTVTDVSNGPSPLGPCYYDVDDLGRAGVEVNAAGRSCNSGFTVSVGLSPDICQTEGVDRCRVSVWATDLAGNVGPKITIDYDIDYTAPTVTINSPAASSWQKASFVLDVTNFDAGTGPQVCRYRVVSFGTETRAWTAYACASDPTITVGAGMDCRDQGGNLCDVSVDVTDGAGGTGSNLREFGIDWVAPDTSNLPADSWNAADFSVTPVGTDPAPSSGLVPCEYRIDDLGRAGTEVDWTGVTCSTAFTVTVGPPTDMCQTEGVDMCRVDIRSTDVAGNVDATPQTRDYDIDYNAPTVSFTPPDGWRNADFSVVVDDTDLGSGFGTCSYEIDDVGRAGIEIPATSRACPDGGFGVSVGGSPDICQTQGVDQCKVRAWATDVSGKTGPSSSITHFSDAFPATTFSNPPWTSTTGMASDGGCGFVSSPYSAHVNGQGVVFGTTTYDLSTSSSATLSLYLRSGDATGTPACDTPDANDLITLDYSLDGAAWNCLKAWDPDGAVVCTGGSANNVPTVAWAQSVITLPSGALAAGFRIRFTTTGAGVTDDYGIDDVVLQSSQVGTVIRYDIDYTAPTSTLSPIDAWKTVDFTTTVTDTDTGGSGLATCYYEIDDTGRGGIESSGTRACNTATPTVTVSATGLCQTQGADTCRVKVWAVDVATNIGSGAQIFYDIDYTAPASALTPVDGWKNADFATTIDDSDATSGPANCYYTIDDTGRAGTEVNDQTRTCDNGFNVPVGPTPDHCQTEGVDRCSVAVRAVDTAGNVGPTTTINYDIDYTAPASTMTPADSWRNADFSTSVSDTDPISGLSGGSAVCRYEIDDLGRGGVELSTTRGCNNGFGVSVGGTPDYCQTQGTNLCRATAWAVDAAGNDARTADRVMMHDEFPAAGAPDSGKWASSLAVTDAGCGATSGANSLHLEGVEDSVTASRDFSQSTSATLTFQIKPGDAAGTPACELGLANSELLVEYTVGAGYVCLAEYDYTGGANTYSCPTFAVVGTGWSARSITLPVGAYNANLQIRFRSDGGVADDWGVDDVVLKGINGAKIIEYDIDYTEPDTTGLPADSWKDSDFTVTPAGSDAHSGVASCQYQIDDLDRAGVEVAWTTIACGSPFTVTVGASPDVCRTEGANKCRVEIRSTDNAGNVDSSPQAINYDIDYNAPVSTLAPADGWKNADFATTVTDSDAGSGLATCNYEIDDTGRGAGAEVSTTRTCNTGPTVTVGPPSDVCQTQGADRCKVTVWATDVSGKGGYSAGTVGAGTTGFVGTLNIGYTFLDTCNLATATGTLTQWSIYVNGATTVKAKIFRDDGTNFVYIGETSAQSPAAAGTYTYAASIAVNVNDIIAVYSSGTANIGYKAQGTCGGYRLADVTATSAKTLWTLAYTNVILVSGTILNAGNSVSINYDIDYIAPTSAITAPPAGWRTSDFSPTVDDNDAVSGLATCYYDLDDLGRAGVEVSAATRTCDTAPTISVGPDPDICRTEAANICRFSVWAVDNAGNVGTKTTIDWSIDYTGPTSTLSPSDGWKKASFATTVVDGDGTSGLASCSYEIDDLGRAGVEATGTRGCQTGFTVTVGQMATHCRTQGLNQCRVRVWAVDNAGITGSGSTIDYDIDYTAPSVTLAPVDSWVTDFSTTVTDTDAHSGPATCRYEIDDLGRAGVEVSTTRTCNAGFSVSVGPNPDVCQTQGANMCRVRVWSIDAAGNDGSVDTIPQMGDDFPTGTLDTTKWPASALMYVDANCGTTSGSFAGKLRAYNSGTTYVETKTFNLAGMASASLTFQMKKGDGAAGCDVPETQDELVLEYWNGASWVCMTEFDPGPTSTFSCANTFEGNFPAGWQSRTVNVPSAALYNGVKFRFLDSATGSLEYDTWAFDDVDIKSVEGAKVIDYDVDFTPPDTSGLPADSWKDVDFSVTPVGTDTGGSGVSTCQYMIDDLGRGDDTPTWTTSGCTPSSFTVQVGPSPDVCRTEGANMCRVQIRAVDVAGNVDPTPQSTDYDIDYNAPNSVITNPADTWRNADFTATIDDQDAGSGWGTCYYEVDDLGRAGIEVPATTRGCPDGSVAVTVGPPTDTCQSEGVDQCKVRVWSTDASGKSGPAGAGGTLFNDTFPTAGAPDSSKWTIVSQSGITVGTACGSRSSPNSLNIYSAVNNIESVAIPLAGAGSATLTYWWVKGIQAASPCEGPDTASEDLWVEYLQANGVTWALIQNVDGTVPGSTVWAKITFTVPAPDLWNGFKMRFRQEGGSGAANDNWGIDDVNVDVPASVGVVIRYDIDYTNPVTTLTGPPDGWFDANFATTVSDSDATSGLQTCYYTVDDLGRVGVEIDSATRTCSTGFTVTVGATATCRTEGSDMCRVSVWSRDNANNLAPVQSRDYDIDFNAPTSSLSPADGWKKEDFSTSVNDDNGGTGSPLNTCHYIIDDLGRAGVELTTTRACDSGFNVPVGTTPDICQTEGANKCHVEVWAVDLAGTEGIHNSIDYDIDFTAPTSTLSPPDGWYRTDIVLTVNDDDPYSGLATCYFEVDDLGRAGIEDSGIRACDGGTTALVGPGAFHCQTEGTDKCRVKVWAVDNLGQISAGTTRDYDIDYTGPTSTITGPADTPKGADFLVNTSDTDSLSGVASCTHRINDLGRAGIEEEATHTCNTNFTVTVSESAVHCQTNGADSCEVRVWSTDGAGNIGSVFLRLYDIDNTKPTSMILSPAVAYKGVDFQVTVDDDPNGGSALTNCYYSVDDLGRAGGPEVNTTRSCPDGSFNVTVGVSPDVCRTEGSNMCRVRVWARNAAGAVGAGTTRTYHIDLTLPLVTFNNPPAGTGFSTDFVIDISDSDPAPGSLFNTTYMVKSLGVQTRGWSTRVANSANSATITVGANKDCRDAGTNTCEVIVSAYDAAGNQRTVSRLFSVPFFGAPPATPSLLHPFDMQRGGPGGTSLPLRFNASDPDNSRIRYQVQIDKFDDMSGTETVVLSDSFEGGTIDTAKWASNTGPPVQNSDCTASSGTNSLEMDGTDSITSVTLNLSRAVTGKVEFNFYTGGIAACPATGSGFDHFVEYLKNDGVTWVQLDKQTGGFASPGFFLPSSADFAADAFWSGFKIRMRTAGGTGSWGIDEFKVTAQLLVADVTSSASNSGCTAGKYFCNKNLSSDIEPFLDDNWIEFTPWAGLLTDNTAYWWRVRALDPSGSQIWSQYTATSSFTIDASMTTARWAQTSADQFEKNVLSGAIATLVGDGAAERGSYVTPLSDNIEGSTAGWTATEVCDSATGPNNAPFAVVQHGTKFYKSATRSWWVDNVGSNASLTNGRSLETLDTPSINVPATAIQPRFKFWHRMWTEAGYDGGFMQYAANGSATFVDVAASDILKGGYGSGLSVTEGACASNSQVYRAAGTSWTGSRGTQGLVEVLVKVPWAAVGGSIKFRWSHVSDELSSPCGEPNAVGCKDGWWVDDASLTYTDNTVGTGNVFSTGIRFDLGPPNRGSWHTANYIYDVSTGGSIGFAARRNSLSNCAGSWSWALPTTTVSSGSSLQINMQNLMQAGCIQLTANITKNTAAQYPRVLQWDVRWNSLPTIPVLVTPANGANFNGGETVNYSWNAGFDAEGDAISYKAYRKTNITNPVNFANTSALYTLQALSGADCGRTITWWVNTTDQYSAGIQNDGYGNRFTFTVGQSDGPPSSPTANGGISGSGAAAHTNTTPLLGWTPTASCSGGQQGFHVQVWTGTGGTGTKFEDSWQVTWNNLNGSYADKDDTAYLYGKSGFTEQPLVRGDKYYMRARTLNGATWSNWAQLYFRVNNYSIATPLNAGPFSPLQVTSGTPWLAWNFSDTDGPFNGYTGTDSQLGWRVQVWAGSTCGSGIKMDDSWPVTWDNSTGPDNMRTDKDDSVYFYDESVGNAATLIQGLDYFYCVSIFDGFEWSAATGIAIHRNGAPPSVQPSAPADGSSVSGVVRLEWLESFDPDGDAVNYEVKWRKVGAGSWYTNSSITNLFWDIGPLAAGCSEQFEWYLRASDPFDPGPAGPLWTFRYSGGDSTTLEPSTDPGYGANPDLFVKPTFSTTGKGHVYKIVYKDCTDGAMFTNPSFETPPGAAWTFQQGGGATAFLSVSQSSESTGGFPSDGVFSYKISSGGVSPRSVTAGEWAQVYQNIDLSNANSVRFDFRFWGDGNTDVLFEIEVWIDDTTVIYSQLEELNQNGVYTQVETDTFSMTGTHKVSFRLAAIGAHSNARTRHMWIDNLRGSPVMKLHTDQDPTAGSSWTDITKDNFDSSKVSIFSDGFESYQSGDPLGAPWTTAGTPTVYACASAYEGNNVLLVNPASGNEDAITPPLNFIDTAWKYRVEFWFRVDTKGNGVCQGPDNQDLELSYRKNGGSWNSIRNLDEGDFNRNFWYKEVIDFSNDFPSAIGGMVEVRLRNGAGSPFLGYAWQIDNVEAVKDRFDPLVWDVPNVRNAVLDGDACDVPFTSTVVRFGFNNGNGELRSKNFDLSGKEGHQIFLSFDYRSIDQGGNSNCKKQDKDLLLQVYSGTTWSTITVLSRNTATNPAFQTRNVSVPEQYRTADHQFRLFVNSMGNNRYWWIDNVRLIDFAPAGGAGGSGTILPVDLSATDPALRDGNLKNGEQYASCGTGNTGCSLAKRTKGAHWHYFTAKVGPVDLRSPVSGTHNGPDVGVTGPTINLRLGINLISIGTNNSSFLPSRTLSWIAANLTTEIADKSLYVYEVRTQEPTGTTRRVITLNLGTSFAGDTGFVPTYGQSLIVRVKRSSGTNFFDSVTIPGMEFAASEGMTVYDNKTIFFSPTNKSYASALTFLLRLAGPQYCYNEAPSSPCPGGAGLNTGHPWGEPWEIMRFNAMTQSWESGSYDTSTGDWVWDTASGMPFPITPGEGYILKYRNAGSGVSQFWISM